MKSFLNNIRKNSIFALVGFFAVGLLLIIYPSIVATVAGYVVGALGIGFGVTKIVGFFSKDEDKKVGIFALTMGIIFAVAGVYVIANPTVVSNFLLSIFGAIILIYGIVKLKNALSLKKSGMNKWYSTLINAVIALLLGLVFVANPKLSNDLIMRLLGTGMIVIAVSDLWTFINISKEFKTLTKDKPNSNEIDGFGVEVEDKDD